MNLADIRRKAMERRTVSEPIPPPRDETVPSERDGEKPLTPSRVAEVESGSAPLPVDDRGAGRGKFTSAADSPSPAGFDPCALIIAGRERAAQVVDPELIAERSQLAIESSLAEFLAFRVGDELYAVPITEIKEIIKPRPLTEVPRAPSYIPGILSLRGVIIPVFDLRERLHFERGQQTGRSRIVVVKRKEEPCGLLVDEVVQVVQLPSDGIEPPPSVLEGIDREFVAGIGRSGEKMVILLSLETLLDIQRN